MVAPKIGLFLLSCSGTLPSPPTQAAAATDGV